VTRKAEKQRKLEALGQITYSYYALYNRLTERRSQDYHDRILKANINCYSVCKMRVAYSLVNRFCNSCRLRVALRDYIQGNTILRGSSKRNPVARRAQQKRPNLYGAYDHAGIHDNPERKTKKGTKLAIRKTRAITRG
jgi:hypothetical protein